MGDTISKSLAFLYDSARNGEKNAEKELFQELLVRFRYLSKRRLGRDYEEDIAHEACMVIVEKYKNLDQSTSFEPWAYQILRNKIGNQLQAQKRRLDRFESSQFDPSAHTSNSSTDPLLRQKLLLCLKSLLRTNPKYGRVLSLSYMGFTPKEICQKLKISNNNMYVILSRSRHILADCLRLRFYDN